MVSDVCVWLSGSGWRGGVGWRGEGMGLVASKSSGSGMGVGGSLGRGSRGWVCLAVGVGGVGGS